MYNYLITFRNCRRNSDCDDCELQRRKEKSSPALFQWICKHQSPSQLSFPAFLRPVQEFVASLVDKQWYGFEPFKGKRRTTPHPHFKFTSPAKMSTHFQKVEKKKHFHESDLQSKERYPNGFVQTRSLTSLFIS